MKQLFVFFDIETLTVNRQAEPKEQQAMEYVVSYKFKNLNNKIVEGVKPNLESFIKYLLTLKVKKIQLLAHNGDAYDFAFLHRKLITEFGLRPKNMFVLQSANHELESHIKNETGNFLHVQRLRSSTRTSLKFMIDNVFFETKDTLPIFHMSVRTIGNTLKDLKLDKHGQAVKLDYADDYTKYDAPEPMSYNALKAYCLEVFNQLNEHAIEYVLNDTRVIFEAFYNYDKIYSKGYDPNKLTLSQNILEQYKLNALASFQLLNTIQGNKRLELTGFNFGTIEGNKLINIYQYIHSFYKGGLNVYNDKFVGKIINDNITHIDLNSSYPTVMRYKQFPTFCVDGGIVNKDIELDNKYYYFIQISKIAFQNLYISQVKSRVLKNIFVKYFSNNTDSIYIQTPHIEILSKFLGKKITKIPAISFLKFEKYPFGGLQTIQDNYRKKTEAKKRGASKGEVAGFKVTLNGIYGIPALRPFFPLYEIDKNGETVSIKDENGNFGFHNRERNITFASSVTAYAFKQLLEPLTYNISGIDNNFIYADTDSIFMKTNYFNSIKNHIFLDPKLLGAWDCEHKNITNMYVMNHKKYAIFSTDKNKIEVFSGGIPNEAFETNKYTNLKDFVKDKFHDKVKIKNLHNVFNHDKVMVLYEAVTELSVGGKYQTHFPRTKSELFKDKAEYTEALLIAYDLELNNEQVLSTDINTLYYETPVGSFSVNEIFPPIYKNDLNSKLSFSAFLRIHKTLKRKIDKNVNIELLDDLRKEPLKL